MTKSISTKRARPGLVAIIKQYSDSVFELYFKIVAPNEKFPEVLHSTHATLAKAEKELKRCGNRKGIYKLVQVV